MAHRQTYAERAAKHPNPAAKALLETIERKRTNLCVSVDVTKSSDFLKVIDTVGPYVCLVKVSIGIVLLICGFIWPILDTCRHHR